MQHARCGTRLCFQRRVHVLDREISLNEISAALVRVRCRMQPEGQSQRLRTDSIEYY